mgnify:CR=1 FL=1
MNHLFLFIISARREAAERFLCLRFLPRNEPIITIRNEAPININFFPTPDGLSNGPPNPAIISDIRRIKHMYIQPEIAADTVFPPDITEHIIPQNNAPLSNAIIAEISVTEEGSSSFTATSAATNIIIKDITNEITVA